MGIGTSIFEAIQEANQYVNNRSRWEQINEECITILAREPWAIEPPTQEDFEAHALHLLSELRKIGIEVLNDDLTVPQR